MVNDELAATTPASWREAFEQAARFFVETVAPVRPGQWDAPGLGEWTVRDLVGHTSRALLTVETYLGRPADRPEVTSPLDYFLVAGAATGGSSQVAQRGREAGAALGEDPAGAVADIAARVLGRLGSVADDALLGTPVGGMRLRDYLPTRTFELVVHTLDLAAALGIEATPPDRALAPALEIVAGLAARRGHGPRLLLASTGRTGLPDGFSILSSRLG